MTEFEKLLENPEFNELFAVSKEEQEIHDSLFKSPRLEMYKKNKQSLNQSLSILGYKK